MTVTLLTKFCPRCGTEQPIECFYVNAGGHDGVSTYCATHMLEINASYRAKQRAKIIQALGGKCFECGLDEVEILEVDHIKPIGKERRRGQAGVWKDFVENPDSLQLLCPNDHARKKFRDRAWGGQNVVRKIPQSRTLKGTLGRPAPRFSQMDLDMMKRLVSEGATQTEVANGVRSQLC